MPTITVLYFASVRELVKTAEEQLDLPDGVFAIEALARLLEQRHPALGGLLNNVRFAVNEAFVERSHAVKAGDVIALIPPVSGG